MLAVDDVGVVVKGYLMRTQFETNLIDVQFCNKCVWDNYENTSAVTVNCSPDHASRCRSSVSRTQTVWLQAFSFPPADQHIEPAKPVFIRKHNRSPLRPPMSSGLTLLVSQMVMACSQRNTRKRVYSSEQSWK
ncbi:uncharacterized protein TNCV_2912771 [Trichonephila clavipes]|nr:uncharacterized protein TNCV_2912771 [Trichonephila clavipes]